MHSQAVRLRPVTSGILFSDRTDPTNQHTWPIARDWTKSFWTENGRNREI